MFAADSKDCGDELESVGVDNVIECVEGSKEASSTSMDAAILSTNDAASERFDDVAEHCDS